MKHYICPKCSRVYSEHELTLQNKAKGFSLLPKILVKLFQLVMVKGTMCTHCMRLKPKPENMILFDEETVTLDSIRVPDNFECRIDSGSCRIK